MLRANDPATGITAREYFAGLAMQGLLSAGFRLPDETAGVATQMADALLRQLAGAGVTASVERAVKPLPPNAERRERSET